MGARVLLLDDDAGFVADAQASLAGIGCQVTWLANGDTGLARAVTDRFDLIVAAAELPGVNGFRVCNRVKRYPNAKDVPVLLLTKAPSEELEAHRALDTHADVYMLKPVAMVDLVAEVQARVAAREASFAAAVGVPGAAPVPRAPPPLPGGKAPPPLPPTNTQRRRMATITGVAPAPRTQPPPPVRPGTNLVAARPANDGEAQRLA